MNLSTWSIRNPIPALLLFILLTMLGLLCFRAMKIQNFPDIDLHTVLVTAALPQSASPAELCNQLAGHPWEPGRNGHTGVEWNQVDAQAARGVVLAAQAAHVVGVDAPVGQPADHLVGALEGLVLVEQGAEVAERQLA